MAQVKFTAMNRMKTSSPAGGRVGLKQAPMRQPRVLLLGSCLCTTTLAQAQPKPAPPLPTVPHPSSGPQTLAPAVTLVALWALPCPTLLWSALGRSTLL